MLKKSIISASIISILIGISSVVKASENNAAALVTNTKYIEKIKTNNIVYDEIITDYINDLNSRYTKTLSGINQANMAKEMTLKPVTMKIDQIKTEQKRNPNQALKNNDDRIKESVKDIRKKEDIPQRNRNIRYPEYVTENELIRNVLLESESTVKKAIKNNLEKQRSIINTTFGEEEKIFVSILKKKMSEFTVTKEEKEFLEKNIKETTLIIKNNPLTVDEQEMNMALKNMDKEILFYKQADDLILKDFEKKLSNLDRMLFDVRWKISRSHSTYPNMERFKKQ